jgi:hypothetical protein
VAPVASAPAPKVAGTPDKPPAMAAVAEPAPAPAATASQMASNGPAATPVPPLMDAKSMMAPPDAAAGKLIAPAALPEATAPTQVATAPASADDGTADAAPAASTVQRTEFAVDLGTANTVGGLRSMWRGLLKSRSNAPLATLHPIIVVKEGGAGLGTQLRLAAGPLSDAAAAAKICAVILERQKTCETTVFDGQQLSMRDDDPPASAKPASVKPASHHRSSRRVTVEEPPKPEPPTTLSSFFGRR